MKKLLDATDVKILDLLQKDGRMKRNEIARIVNLSIPSVSERMRKLQEKGVIKQYTAILNAKTVGLDVTAFITILAESSKHYKEIVKRCNENSQIQECHSITGSGSHLLKVHSKDTSSLEELLSEIQQWPGVTGTQTNVVLSTYKETTALNQLEVQ
jgi:Lrp/AsnC family leucine-responsive transcriptional regulator